MALRSPYCAWHRKNSKCVSIPADGQVSKRDYIQSLLKGNHSECPKLATASLGTTSSSSGSSSSNGLPSEQQTRASSKSSDPIGSQTVTLLSKNGDSKEVDNPIIPNSNPINPRTHPSHPCPLHSIIFKYLCQLRTLLTRRDLYPVCSSSSSECKGYH